MKRLARVASRDRGAAAVEFAFVLPVLLLLVFGIVDFGRALNARIVLTEAASEAARSLAVGGTVDQAEADARATLDGSVVNPDDLQFPVATRCTAGATGTQSAVRVTVRLPLVTPLPVSFDAFDLSAVGARPCAA